MPFPPYLTVCAIVLATLSIFWLPWICSLALIFLAGLAVPPVAVVLGILVDLLYYPGQGIPWGTVSGLLLGACAAFVRYFVRTRIM